MRYTTPSISRRSSSHCWDWLCFYTCALQPACAPRSVLYALSLPAGRHLPSRATTIRESRQPSPPCVACRPPNPGWASADAVWSPTSFASSTRPTSAKSASSHRTHGCAPRIERPPHLVGAQRTNQARWRYVRPRRRGRQCVVKSYLQWLRDSDFDATCSLCRKSLQVDDVLRLTCLGAASRQWR